MRKFCGREKIDLEILENSHVFSTPEYESGFWNTGCLNLHVCMYVRLANARTVERIVFTFGTQEFIHYRSMHCEYEYSSFENKDPSHGPQKRKWLFSRKQPFRFRFN
jgi:hypothetical protein